ncbi:hypothetical protein ACF07F_15800 [Streptomyces sp. NPDC015237]|uniref:hypothetical protein n=1 Tax=Streptomyces sp. NPDC015237 TaxID=3364949 RepID=UPI0036FB4E84
MGEAIKMRIPSYLADLLVSEGYATPTRGRRSSLWALDGDFLGNATTVLALLQAPQTVAYLAQAIRKLARRARDEDTTGSPRLSVEATGPSGQIRFDGEASVEEIERLLRQTIFVQPTDPQEVHDASGTD